MNILVYNKFHKLISVVRITDQKVIKAYEMVGKKEIIIEGKPRNLKEVFELLRSNQDLDFYNYDKRKCILCSSEMGLGEYHERVYRPILSLQSIPFLLPYLEDRPNLSIPIDEDIYFESVNQVDYVTELLLKISRVIKIESENLNSYGNDMRNLLILICTEIEAQWRGVLNSNQFQSKKKSDRYNTQDYVKLCKILHLKEYGVKFRNFTKLNPLEPYRNWSSEEPTKSIPWYDAYNKIKHDRSEYLRFASIEHLLNAYSALIILLVSQYGEMILKERGLRDIVVLDKKPQWEDSEKYLPPDSLGNFDWHKKLLLIS